MRCVRLDSDLWRCGHTVSAKNFACRRIVLCDGREWSFVFIVDAWQSVMLFIVTSMDTAVYRHGRQQPSHAFAYVPGTQYCGY